MIKDGDDVLGRRAKIKVVKNKGCASIQTPCRVRHHVRRRNFERAGEILDLGVEYDIINKSGSWFSYNGTKIAQGAQSRKTSPSGPAPELAEEIAHLPAEAMRNAEKNPAARKA